MPGQSAQWGTESVCGSGLDENWLINRKNNVNSNVTNIMERFRCFFYKQLLK